MDFHSHLLPGIDDGVKTIYESAYILEQFEELGIKKVITTPHVIRDVWPNSTEIIRQKHAEMCKVLKTLKIDIALESAAEYMLDDLFYQRLKEKDILTIMRSYILVEMSTFNPPMNLNEILFDIKLAEYKPILAHPERYTFYFDHFSKFEELKESGFLFQLNLLSISGHYGNKVQQIATKLLNDGFYDFTSSDIHNRNQLEALEKGFVPKLATQVQSLMKNNSIFN